MGLRNMLVQTQHLKVQYCPQKTTMKENPLSGGELQVAHLLVASAWRETVRAQIHSDNDQLLRILLAV